MDRLKRSHFLAALTGKVHLTQYDAVASINPDLARRTLDAQRATSPQRVMSTEGGVPRNI